MEKLIHEMFFVFKSLSGYKRFAKSSVTFILLEDRAVLSYYKKVGLSSQEFNLTVSPTDIANYSFPFVSSFFVISCISVVFIF